MCFIVSKDDDHVYVAQEDIVCYKVLDYQGGVYQSFHKGFVYGFNRVFTQPFRIKRLYDRGGEKINVGFHSFVSMDKGLDIYETWCYGVKNGVARDKVPALVRCRVPKGTMYFINREIGNIVSESIVVEKVIKQYEK